MGRIGSGARVGASFRIFRNARNVVGIGGMTEVMTENSIRSVPFFVRKSHRRMNHRSVAKGEGVGAVGRPPPPSAKRSLLRRLFER